MGSRFPSHQLSNGLYVSGRPEQPKERPPTMSSIAMPYTGGDIKKSGELGKMFDIPVDGSRRKSGPINNAPSRTASFGGAGSHSGQLMPNAVNRVGSASAAGVPGSASLKKTNSGPLNRHGEPMKKSSGPQAGVTSVSRQNSGPLTPVLPTTGLITSGPISSGPLNSSGAPRKASGQLDSTGSVKLHSASIVNNLAVTNLSQEEEYSFRKSFPKPILWAMVLLFVMGFIAGGFILGAVHNPILLVVVVVLFGAVAAVFTWNTCWGRKAITGFIARYPDAELRTARDGQFVKVSGVRNILTHWYWGWVELISTWNMRCSAISFCRQLSILVAYACFDERDDNFLKVVTCGNVPLESSFQRVPRCVYTSTSLYEYRGWDSKAANPTHRRFTWGLRSVERHVVDFYISDFQSGLRALVKTGYGAKVTPYVDESVIVDINQSNRDMSQEFIRWLGERNLSSDDRTMQLKEGYIKEGSTVSVMGVVQRNDNVLMIVPPPEPIPTGCQWAKCILPATLEGIVLRCEDTSKIDVIPV
ncbi:hypothetical protein Acr_20g0009520 [Actinidia rufa]|uniref:Ubiquitin-specific protease family C19-related protein n=1 Tax=Actinidia rufa TaxID=165716 RepID=A0A7J0GEB6_9ERIC|nr:hypothetical protein Acr_20g0009520 [Actinidia rufa]